MDKGISQKLKAYLLNHGIKQSWLAAKIYMSPSVMYHAMNGSRTLSAEDLIACLDVLGISLDELRKESTDILKRS